MRVLSLNRVYYSNMENTPKRGGARRNTGPKTELMGQPARRVQVRLDDRSIELLRVLGNGNVSRGARIAADVAYDRYQRGLL